MPTRSVLERCESRMKKYDLLDSVVDLPKWSSAQGRGPQSSLGAAATPLHISELLAAERRLVSERIDSFSLYIHVPFCPSRCFSCDHQTVIQHDQELINRYLTAMDSEFDRIGQLDGIGPKISKIQLGGGSPNYLSDSQLARLFQSLESRLGIGPAVNVSMDINPRYASRRQLSLLRGFGVTQLNLEVRDVDANVQMALGRSVSLDLLEDVMCNARELGFAEVHMDLLFGLPGQTVSGMRDSVRNMAELGPDLLLVQPFERRPNLYPHQSTLASDRMPSLAQRLAMFNSIVDHMESSGYQWIGLNGFVRSGHPFAVAQSRGDLRVNTLGFAVEGSDFVVGCGLGAISELPGLMAQNQLELLPWLRAVERNGCAPWLAVDADDPEVIRRTILRQLQSGQGVATASYDRDVLDDAVGSLLEVGYVGLHNERYRLTMAGRYSLAHVLGDSSPSFRWY